ncbi:SDR family oxidoreductase [Dysgonomonas sp. ZJ709]|uniref:SDR family oxidoreductase n=1 Tax=Dysgonomonas sp. ZJ709 TaxID=2709797 RepID=UPI0013EBF066|nr:SDR family oxidoreductase [Dysgonomonas sp. ZJ709]
MKTILITGASSGIGKETAILFAEKGWNVAATMRSPEKLSIFAENRNISTYLLDVKNKDSIRECIQHVIQDFSKIDAIVNNAGIYTINPLELSSDEIIDDILETNIKGVLYTTKAILEHFRENKSGVIVNISSIAGRATFPFQSVYHTSKWAIEGFSESLYYELEPIGIKVKVVEPGVVKTELYNSVLDSPLEQYPDEYRDRFKKSHHSLINNYKNGYSPKQDAQTIYKAVNSRNSKLRYPSDNTTKLAFFLRALLPLSVFQKIIKRLNGI